MCEIEDLKARQIIDSRGVPTIEAEVYLSDGTVKTASVPSGASTGIYEAVELRDNISSEYCGKGVQKAVNNVNSIIAPNLIGENVFNQNAIDSIMLELDGSFNKSNLGANAILSVSLACAKAAAASLGIPLYRYLGGISACVLPVPMMNIINGGKHANNGLDFQEFMIVPVEVCSFSDAIKAGIEIFQTLKKILKSQGQTVSVGDEGGFAPNINSTAEAVELLINAIEQAGYSTNNIKIALDAAASEFYEEGECSNGVCSLSYYHLRGENRRITSDEMVEYLVSLVNDYPIVSIEDGLSQDDLFGWINLTKKLGDKCKIVGDDIFVTNTKRLRDGINKNIANSIIIKPNQIGTLTETLDTILIAHKNGYTPIISHRSGETEESFIADLAVATNCGYIKAGSISRTDRTCKYNRLLKIEEELENAAMYLGLHKQS